jgi:GNAT superfamily N-acetyltransferase
MELGVRPETEGLYSNLLDECFKVPSGCHFLDDFPVWNVKNQKDPTKFLKLAAIENDAMISTVSARMADLYVNEDRLPVAIIGGVATHPEWIRKGYAKQGILKAIEWAQKKDAAVIALWGNEYEFYRNLGFELCGQQIRIPVKRIAIGNSKVEIQSGWTPGIWEMIKRRKSGLIHKEEDLKWYIDHKNVQWYWIGHGSMPKAYVAYGKGIDLGGMIHEWGGSPTDLINLLTVLSKKHPEAELLGNASLFQLYGFPFDQSQVEFLCLSRVLNPHRVFRSFYPQVPFQGAVNAEGKWNISMGDSSYSNMTDGELTSLLFNPHSRSPYSIPIWFWGLDAA